MNARNFLSVVQQQYDFTRANAILSETNLKNCWKQWFTAELVHMLNQSEPPVKTETDCHYPSGAGEDDKAVYLSFHPTKGVEAVSEKRNASRSDFGMFADGGAHFFEIRCANEVQFAKNKDLAKFEADIVRIEALKAANPKLNMTALFAFYGNFTSKQIESFTVMDNSSRTTYLLDTALTGSTSISRFCQIARNGDPRLCLAAFSV